MRLVHDDAEYIRELTQDVYDLVWCHLDGMPNIDGELAGKCADLAERAVRKALVEAFTVEG